MQLYDSKLPVPTLGHDKLSDIIPMYPLILLDLPALR